MLVCKFATVERGVPIRGRREGEKRGRGELPRGGFVILESLKLNYRP